MTLLRQRIHIRFVQCLVIYLILTEFENVTFEKYVTYKVNIVIFGITQAITVPILVIYLCFSHIVDDNDARRDLWVQVLEKLT